MKKATKAQAKVRLGTSRDATLRMSDAAADYLAREARLEVEAGLAQVHESHKALLDARQNAVAEGREKILNWDAAKRSLRVTRR